jgi:hypothetical protein
MAIDIRRMSKEDLDELNRQAKVWRASRDKPTANQSAQRAEVPTPSQMDLFDAEKEKQ